MIPRSFGILTVLLCMANAALYAQDSLVTKQGEYIACTVLKISPTFIDYTKYDTAAFDNIEPPPSYIKTGNVLYIKYRNGEVDSLNDITYEHIDDMAYRGKEDANHFYNKYKAARIGTLATTVVAGGIGGLIPAIVCTATPPNEYHLNYPDPKLMNDETYSHYYIRTARHVKAKKVWGGFAIGVVIDVVAGIVIGFLSRPH